MAGSVTPGGTPAPSVLGIGDCTVDLYVDRGVQYPGGNALNVPVMMARLGARAAFLGCIGPDRLGRLIEEGARAEGIDLSRLRRLEAPTCWSRIRHRGGDRVFDGSRPATPGSYALGPDDLTWIGRFDHVHSSIYSLLDEELPRIRRALRPGATLSYDFSEDYDAAAFERVAPHVDVAFVSETGRDAAGCAALAGHVAGFGPGTVVVTRGAAGAMVRSGGAVHEVPAAPARIVDTLGAGDGLIAGFLMALLAGSPPAEALAAGAQEAARVCGHDGAFGRGAPMEPGQPGLIAPRPGDPGLKPPPEPARTDQPAPDRRIPVTRR